LITSKAWPIARNGCEYPVMPADSALGNLTFRSLEATWEVWE